jgi:hypothetical protein
MSAFKPKANNTIFTVVLTTQKHGATLAQTNEFCAGPQWNRRSFPGGANAET